MLLHISHVASKTKELRGGAQFQAMPIRLKIRGFDLELSLFCSVSPGVACRDALARPCARWEACGDVICEPGEIVDASHAKWMGRMHEARARSSSGTRFLVWRGGGEGTESPL